MGTFRSLFTFPCKKCRFIVYGRHDGSAICQACGTSHYYDNTGWKQATTVEMQDVEIYILYSDDNRRIISDAMLGPHDNRGIVALQNMSEAIGETVIIVRGVDLDGGWISRPMMRVEAKVIRRIPDAN